MALVRTARHLDAPVDLVWALVTDWPAHSRWIPFTEVAVDADSPVRSGLGTRFTGRTALGPVGFDDPMTVTEWQPPDGGTPGRCRVVKRGRWLTGWAEIEVRPEPGGCRLSWVEDVRTRWTPRWADPVAAAAGDRLFALTLRRIAAELAGRG
ncbi:MAG TPA: SRPBCC family protein [Jatrophihabitans sp.]|nr:SRPBCC family protein [Jatrophihabitans sp.]